MKHLPTISLACWLTALVVIFVGCTGSHDKDLQPTISESEVLMQYLEEHGDIVNRPSIPHMVQAEGVFEKLHASNQLIIDVRPAEAFQEGHILHAINITGPNILDYFERIIEPNSFDRIVLVCDHGMYSGFVAAILEMLGYKNIFFMRYGLSSWNMDIAKANWLSNLSSHMTGKLDTIVHQKPAKGLLPVINTGKTNGYDILRARAQQVLEDTQEDILVYADSLISHPDRFFIINYWPKNLYDQGHIKGAVQYDPKTSLRSDKDLTTLPTDKPIVLYCYTGHHSNYPIAFLRLLGYDARHLPYGVNAFVQQLMLDTQPASRSFNKNMVRNMPFTGSPDQALTPQSEIKTEVVSVQGGC